MVVTVTMTQTEYNNLMFAIGAATAAMSMNPKSNLHLAEQMWTLGQDLQAKTNHSFSE